MKKILLPVELSELDDYAYDLAHRIAGITGAEILVLHIIPAPAEAFFDPRGNLKEDEGEDYRELRAVQSSRAEQLDEWAKDKPAIGRIDVKIGRVEEDILQRAEENDIDLVVMATHGASGLEEALRGSHAGHLTQSSPVPVLSLKCDRSGYPIRDILLLSDFHETEQAFELSIVKMLKDAFNARLHLLKIVTRLEFETTREVRTHMEAFAERNELGDDVEFHVYNDDTVEKGIIHFSADTGMDFIAIGTHQRKGLNAFFRPSLASALVNHVWQPILTFRL